MGRARWDSRCRPGSRRFCVGLPRAAWRNRAPDSLSIAWAEDFPDGAVPDDTEVGTVLGTLSATDPNLGDEITFSIASDPDEKFTLDGADLKLAAELDFGTAASHEVTVRATDSRGLSIEDVLTLSVQAGGGGGGGAPEWVLEGALFDLDFENSRYWATSVLAAEDVVADTSPIVNGEGYDAYYNQPSGAQNEILGTVAEILKTLNWTLLLDMTFEDNSGGAAYVIGILNGDDSVEFGISRNNQVPSSFDNTITAGDYNTDVSRFPAGLVIEGIPANVKYAVTRTNAKIARSLNGSIAEVDNTPFTGDSMVTRAYFNFFRDGSFLMKRLTAFEPKADADLAVITAG